MLPPRAISKADPLSRDRNWMDPDQAITPIVLTDIIVRMQLRKEVDPRLLLRTLQWAHSQLTDLHSRIDRARHALGEQ